MIQTVASIIAALESSSSPDILAKRLSEDEDEIVRINLAAALAGSRRPERDARMTLLIALVQDRALAVRSEAIVALGRIRAEFAPHDPE